MPDIPNGTSLQTIHEWLDFLFFFLFFFIYSFLVTRQICDIAKIDIN
jgi:hypothetical protein